MSQKYLVLLIDELNCLLKVLFRDWGEALTNEVRGC
jgi:hypothetical protein